MARPWRMRAPDAASVRGLVRAKGWPELLARLLVARGHTEADDAERHLRASPMSLHDPALFPGMETATARIARAIGEGETILVHGDYDVDGITGTALLVRLLRMLGGRVTWHIPNRLEDGYSFGAHSVRKAEETGARVVISVDNGTSAHAVIAELAARGVDTIVTDHHEPPDGPLPDALAIINPKLPGTTYPWRELCGGAVAFKLAWGLAQAMSGGRRASPELKAYLEEATGLVAIATVCDVVPLVDENRVFARYGLGALAMTSAPGPRALLATAGVADRALTAEDVAFRVGPRLNASGRLGSADEAVELLLARDEDTARRLAARLDDLNGQRREVEAEVLAEARAQATDFPDPERDPVLVLAGDGWHQGVVGIVAARLVEEFERPAVVIGLDGEAGRGSARTLGGFDVLEAISAAAPHLERYGGHRQAAGLEVRADAVEHARAAICARASEMQAGGRPTASELWIDDELAFPAMNEETMRLLDRLAPYGEANEEPVLLSRGVHLATPPRAVGADGSHLLVELREGHHVMRAVSFGQGARIEELEMGRPLDAVYSPRWNTFRGQTSLELQLLDFRPA